MTAEWMTNLNQLRKGVFVSMGDINAVVNQGSKMIADTLGRNTEAGRKAMAANMRAGVQAIAIGIKRGYIDADAGIKRIKKLMREADLIEGLRPAKFAKEFASMFKKAGGATPAFVGQVIQDLGKMPRPARQKVFDMMMGMLRTMAQGRPKMEREVELLQSKILRKLNGIKITGPRIIDKFVGSTRWVPTRRSRSPLTSSGTTSDRSSPDRRAVSLRCLDSETATKSRHFWNQAKSFGTRS
jgi:hypothetical protein